MTLLQATRTPDPQLASEYRSAGHWRDRTIGEYLNWCVRERPDAVAAIDGDQRVTFVELDAQVHRVAAFLSGCGVTAGEVVSFQLPNVLAALVTFHATLRIGAVANPIVPIYRGNELRHILGEARSRVAVIPSLFRGFDYPELYDRLLADLPDLVDVVVVGEIEPNRGLHRWQDIIGGSGAACSSAADVAGLGATEKLGQREAAVAETSAAVAETSAAVAETSAAVGPDDVALLLYTSGTTSVPKGVLHTHNTLVFEAHLIADWGRLDERDVILKVAPVTHATGILNGLLVPVVIGASVVLQESWDAKQALKLIERERVSYIMLSTPFLRGLLLASGEMDVDVSSLRRIGCGGADIPVELMRAARERLCDGIVRVYGMSEGFTVTSTTSWDPPGKRLETDGRWLCSYDGRIIGESGETVPPGVAGEVCWRGAGMFLGFLDSALNASAFTAAGRYRSGDLGIIDEDGYLTITGRLKDVINRSGEKISAYEVEQLLAEHPAISEVAVVAQPNAVTGERGCAWIVPAGDAKLSLREVADFLVGREVAKQKIPEDLVMIDELPKNAAGKVRKSVLRDWARQRVVGAEEA